MRRSARFLLVLAFILAAPGQVLAGPDFNVQAFRPSPHVGDLWTVSTTDIPEHLKWKAGLFFNYGVNPLVYDFSGSQDGLITSQMTADLHGSLALWEHLSLGIDVPLFLYNGSDPQGLVNGAPDVKSFSLGDISFSPKVVILNSRKTTVGLGILLPITLPTAQSGNFTGEANLTFTPTLVLDAWLSGVKLALNAGYRIREDQTLDFLEVKDELHLGGGIEVPLYAENLFAIGEVTSYTAADEVFGNADRNRVEGDLGLRFISDSGLTAGLGGGKALTSGYGSVGYRVFGEIGFWPRTSTPGDRDLDGVTDDLDRCPDDPEDPDGFQDGDGCPDRDNDNDGVPDLRDECPNRAEDRDGFADQDGCPDLDNDQDGVDDLSDKCPNDPEDRDGFEDQDGCADPDNDLDGLKDQDDKCPNEAEVINGVDDEDGCPDQARVQVKDNKIEIFDRVHFKTGKAVIMKDSYSLLDEVANILVKYPNLKLVRVEGHTDSTGSHRMNLKLSQARADSVRKYLISKGIDGKRLVAEGFGPDRPIADNATDEGRAANRRVEFNIVEQ